MEERITSAQNPLARRLRSLADAKTRKRERACLVEGEVMIGEALQSGMKPLEALFESETPLMRRLLGLGAVVKTANESVIKSVCETVSPQGCCASFAINDNKPIPPAARLLVALDGVQDPGNLGTILRTMDAAGFEGALLSPVCADVYSPKVQRAAMGSAFRVPTARAEDLPETLKHFRDQGFRLVISALDGNDLYRASILDSDRLILVIGNEARGVCEEIKALSDLRLKIPMRGAAESLNAAVAAGILMYELTRPHIV